MSRPRVVAIVPMRHNSERVVGKNYRQLGGRPLYHHVVESLLAVEAIDEVVIDTDSDLILADAESAFPTVTLLRRPEHLRAGEVPMNDVLQNSVAQLQSDIVLQTHSTNPFLSTATISLALDKYFAGADLHDSVFGVTRIQGRLWTADVQPVNHDPAVLLRTQDLAPLYLENSCFYIFPTELFRATGNRIGSSPLMLEVPPQEALDIDEESDFELAVAVDGARRAR